MFRGDYDKIYITKLIILTILNMSFGIVNSIYIAVELIPLSSLKGLCTHYIKTPHFFHLLATGDHHPPSISRDAGSLTGV